MEIQELLMKALTQFNQSRARSMQTEIGVSQIGGCRKQIWLQMQGTEKTNATIQLPALMGTAIHAMIEEAIIAYSWGENETEIEVEYEGLKGHIDLYIPELGAVVDWKTVKTKGLKDFPSEQQRWQVQIYGYLLEMNGRKVDTVSLVAIPRDGDERTIKTHTETYNKNIVTDALAWLADVQTRVDAPLPEKYKAFCNLYCSYYGDSCGGM